MEVSGDLVFLIQQKLQKALKPERYMHTLGVAYLSASLAMCHGVSHRDALIAGLLHDCAKNYPEDFMLSECMKLGISISEQEQHMPQLIHAAYGAYLAATDYHISQEDIILAIRNHTLGRPEMTPLEQIVYLADYLEPERNHPTVPVLDEIRKTAFQNLDEAVVLVSENSIRYFEKTGKETDPMVYRVNQYYKEKIRKDT